MKFHQGPFHASFFTDDCWSKGLRSYLEYRDLGMLEATDRQLQAHVIRVTESCKGPRATTTTPRNSR